MATTQSVVDGKDATCSNAYTSTSVVHDGRISTVRFIGHVNRRVDYHVRAYRRCKSVHPAGNCASKEKTRRTRSDFFP
eukprot:COSAG02_NODE_3739_length_6303_cov_12.797228_7_plen_78_part_00